ncbi:MAG: hypothetical protein ACLFPV_04660 [Spirochaetaceae bacterium]
MHHHEVGRGQRVTRQADRVAIRSREELGRVILVDLGIKAVFLIPARPGPEPFGALRCHLSVTTGA